MQMLLTIMRGYNYGETLVTHTCVTKIHAPPGKNVQFDAFKSVFYALSVESRLSRDLFKGCGVPL